ncbi:MAG: hypothetical protein CO108_21330 [Deltaproteobacteria bacterium CG_4_9_14_3_um_filter_63_12]|nr:MAG: hypothetical protein CO108_21330 [Deltaproteobacteria bacterium CG_4_9_14_3_um_filter_63_12]
MENWQLAAVILLAVLVGAAIPAFLALAVAFYRAAREISELGRQLRPTLEQIHLISERVETLSRGLAGGEKTVADFLSSVSDLQGGLDRNMKIFNISSAIIASAGPAITAFIHTMRAPDASCPPTYDDRTPYGMGQPIPSPTAHVDDEHTH